MPSRIEAASHKSGQPAFLRVLLVRDRKRPNILAACDFGLKCDRIGTCRGTTNHPSLIVPAFRRSGGFPGCCYFLEAMLLPRSKIFSVSLTGFTQGVSSARI